MHKLCFWSALALVLTSCHTQWNLRTSEVRSAVAISQHPLPTESGLEEDVEERGHRERDAWIERMHRTAPGQDWRAIERANAEREMRARNLANGNPSFAAAANAWSEVGSANLAGRMWSAALASDGVTVYAGSDLGGLWKGDLTGSNWKPLGDNLYGGAYDVVAIPGELPGDPDVLMVRGAALYVTRDEGATWEQPTGFSNVSSIRGLARLEDAPHTLLVLAQTTILGNACAIFASTDHGRTFTKRYQHAASGNSAFFVPRRGPGAANSIYLAVRGNLFSSSNGGASFSLAGVADATATDCILTGSEAGAPTLYAALNSGGTWKLWRSDDAGAHFTSPFTIGGFYGTLAASSVSPNVVLYGDIEAHRSTDGGATFASVNSWGSYYGDPAHKLHADLFGFDVFADPQHPSGEIWFVGCDGGLYTSFDSVASVSNVVLHGLGVSQYYSTLTSKTNPNLIVAGAQDQGYQRGSYVAPSGSGPSTPFTQLISGDYGHLTSSDGSHQRVISTYPGFILIQDGENNPSLSTANFPSGASNDWLPPVVADPLDANVFYFCGNQLWKYTRQTNGTWLVTLQSSQNFAIGGNFITALAFAPSDPQRVYAVNDGGRIWYSSDHGVTWTPSNSSAPGQQYFYGNALSVHPTNALEVAIGGSGYATSAVIRSTDGGANFAPENSGLPQTLVYSLAYATDGTGDLYAGHQTGALRWHRATAQWENLTTLGSPITVYWSAEIADNGATARFGTYGRGIWDYAIQPKPSWSIYGTGKTNSYGSQPFLAATGTPSLSKNDFRIQVNNAIAGKTGVLIYGSQSAQIPFQGGTLWIKPPITRGPKYTLDPVGYADVAIPIDATMLGITRYFEAWFRDPQHPDGTGVGLSNGGAATFGL